MSTSSSQKCWLHPACRLPCSQVASVDSRLCAKPRCRIESTKLSPRPRSSCSPMVQLAREWFLSSVSDNSPCDNNFDSSSSVELRIATKDENTNSIWRFSASSIFHPETHSSSESRQRRATMQWIWAWWRHLYEPLEFFNLSVLLRSNLSKRSKKHWNRKTPSSQLLSSPNV